MVEKINKYKFAKKEKEIIMNATVITSVAQTAVDRAVENPDSFIIGTMYIVHSFMTEV